MGRFQDLLLYNRAVLQDEHVIGDVTPLINGLVALNRPQLYTHLSMRTHVRAFEVCAKETLWASEVLRDHTRSTIRRMLDPLAWGIKNLDGRTYSTTVPLLPKRQLSEKNPARIRNIDRWVSVSATLAELLLAMREPMIINAFGNFWGTGAGVDREDDPLYVIGRFQAYVELATGDRVPLAEITRRRRLLRDCDLPLAGLQRVVRRNATARDYLEPFHDIEFEEVAPEDRPHRVGLGCRFDHVIAHPAEGYQLWLNRDAEHPRPLLLELRHADSGRYFPLQQIAPPLEALHQPQSV